MADTASVSLDEMMGALAEVQRRRLLIALLKHNPQDDLPTVVADDPADAKAMEQLIQIQHTHLPKLVAYGFIEWDDEADEVTKGPAFDQIKPLLELLDAHADELPSDWL